jgi:cell division protein FtsW
MALKKPDRLFFFIVLGLSLFGYFIFSSASLGLLSRQGANFNLVAFKQFAILIVGIGLFMLVSKIDFQFWRKHSLGIFIGSIVFSLLLFIPGVGLKLGGATRWIMVGPFSVQPSEFLKLGFVLYLAAWLAKSKTGVQTVKKGLLPFLIILGIVSVLMVLQPDIDTLVIMFAAGVAMYFVSGARWRHLAIICLIIVMGITAVGFYKPYIVARVKTYLNPDKNVLGASYQVNQSLIAVGSGGLTGRGFGQSIQKFKYLPEPIGDSIFSVASEEFGFMGAMVIICLFLIFALSGLKIALRTSNPFGRLVSIGIVIMILTGTFINIASMLAIIPLTGTPLLFISHGGTALLMALLEAGIILNVSRSRAS